MTGRVRAGILGTGSALPNRVLTNADLEQMVETNNEWIVTRTGIEERRIAEPGEATSDYVAAACQRALEMSGVAPSDVDMLICATVTPDHAFPSTGNLVQERLGLTKASAFDLSAACSGFLYALSLGTSMIEAGRAKYVLVSAGDILSRIVDYTDRTTCVLFGDGAGAVLLGPAEGDSGVMSFAIHSDGSGKDTLYLKAGGSRYPATQETVAKGDHYLKMAGRDTFKFAVQAMVSATEEVLEQAGLQPEDVALYVPHQANLRIIDAARRRFHIPDERVALTLNKYGNTSGSSIPIALDEFYRAGRVKKGDVVLCVGFGAGLTWGAAAFRL
ncbi:beta-ketoacyl-ACP synthase III [Alicyclobacillus fastidiosus]|uniref:Beta-ketoacyl-[acyl-carrier-protein] synthase III n=1 Tax=Alicyclobacillus fastidiosus TaxID=392011 RepID=A0ABV5AI51_9BACL|nr:beta-ketoacyl-ACP synthase III [Alicyclobacillus fastidiosus]WEH08062.1 ketoacyl-ACP synthase III [Alicyclobacillus fastidiosus]